MGSVLESFPFLSEHEPQRPYVPFPVARQSGLIDHPEDLAEELEVPPGQLLANGYIPNAHHAGLVANEGKLLAFDLTSMSVEGPLIRVGSTSKSRVKKRSGEILDEGAGVCWTDKDLFRFTAFAIDRSRRPWLVDMLQDRIHTWLPLGNIIVFNTSTLELPEYEIVDVDVNTGSVLAKPRQPVF